MANRSYDVYRPRRRSRHGFWRVLLWALLALVLLGIAAFYACQKYIVYEGDTLRVVFPIMETPAAAADPESTPQLVDTEVVIGEADYSAIVTNAGQGLDALRGRYLTADQLTEQALTTAAAQVKTIGGDTLVLQMKPPSGMLSWKSGVAMADAYGVNGTRELADTIAALKAEQGVRFVAAVSCCVDSAMAQRYTALTLKSGGAPYSDGAGGWLDPYNQTVREYLTDLCKELADMGFDEIAFSYLQTPFTTADLTLGDETGGDAARTDAVMSLAKALRTALQAKGVKVSIICSAESIVNGRADQTGQDLTLLPKLFDRMCVFADASNLETLKAAIAADEDFDVETRFVPFIGVKQEEGSWVVMG